VPFRLLNADPGHYPGKIIEDSLIPGTLDAVLIWGPIGGYYAQRAREVELAVIPLRSEAGVRFDFGVAMGVRPGEKRWRDLIQTTLDQNQEDIHGILRQYGVPLVDEDGKLLP
jgi:hypothetical protein